MTPRTYLIGTAFLLCAGAASTCPAQDPVRIRIRSADPWMVKALLEGLSVRSPELSTLPGFQGLPQTAANAASSFLKGGKLIVNPTDNSL